MLQNRKAYRVPPTLSRVDCTHPHQDVHPCGHPQDGGCTHPHQDVHPCGHPQDGGCFEKTTLFSVLTATPPNGGEGCFRSWEEDAARVTRGARNVYNTKGILSHSEQKEKNDQGSSPYRDPVKGMVGRRHWRTLRRDRLCRADPTPNPVN